MKKALIAVGITVLGVLAIAGFTAASVVGIYNETVVLSNDANTSWSQVETQVQRRFDLLPNLVEATKGIFEQEREVFGAIALARTHYASAKQGTNERIVATNQLDGAMARLLVVMENYPNLKSNEQVHDLMDEIAGSENRVNVARQRYNKSVQEYDTYIQSFPQNFIAGFFGFKDKPLFKAEVVAQSVPHLSLHLGGSI